MFSQAYSPQNPYTFGTCNAAAGSVFCNWTAQNGATITMTVRNITGGSRSRSSAVARSVCVSPGRDAGGDVGGLPAVDERVAA
jgi:hypothetical protein